MKTFRGRSLVFIMACVGAVCLQPALVSAQGAAVKGDERAWPEVTAESKPWTYWWWMGSAVEKAEITKNLEHYCAAGLGGVHIIPVYGVKGWEDRYIDYLSPEWMEMFAYTVKEAGRLGMGVDMSTGTGWPFGGPQITPAFAAKRVKISRTGNNFTAKAEGTGQKVKRAAPGGEGLVMDPFSREALDLYLRRFDQAFEKTGARPRAFYNDSYEVYGADWTANLLEEFKKRRGYDLRGHLGALAGKGDKDYISRVRCDFQETISDLLREKFTKPWTDWAHGQGAITRNEAHGSPGNLLDLYAAADIPETEIFGPSGFPIPGLEYFKTMPEVEGKPDVIMMKFASSAAHVAGKPLVSSESCTWLNEHFTVTLAQVKPELDQLWLGGINHIFFHGITYSPTYEAWPGWLWYAETNFGPSNTFWRELPALNAYIGRAQAFLQSGQPDNDILVYWPIHDLWSGVYDESLGERLNNSFRELRRGNPKEFAQRTQTAFVRWYEARSSLVDLFAVHNSQDWLTDTAFGKAANLMRQQGFSFDYISDRMIAGTRVQDGKIITAGSSYSVLVVPACKFMPVETLEKLAELSRSGATIIFQDELPEDVPGWGNLQARQDRMKSLKAELKTSGKARIGKDLMESLQKAGAIREPIAEHGNGFVRRRDAQGCIYFFSNLTAEAWQGWTPLGKSAESAMIFDALTGKSGKAALKKGGAGETLVYLQLEPGQSLILRTLDRGQAQGEPWRFFSPAGESIVISGQWRIEFIEGGSELPDPVTLSDLKSWTDLGDRAKCFFGTARYTIEFNLPDPAKADEWVLELGKVHESAKVTVNGHPAGGLFCHPFKLGIVAFLQPGLNRLELEVTNLPINRIIEMDREKVKWKKFHDVNYPSMNGPAFDAAGWKPFSSGLLGPVKLAPEKSVP